MSNIAVVLIWHLAKIRHLPNVETIFHQSPGVVWLRFEMDFPSQSEIFVCQRAKHIHQLHMMYEEAAQNISTCRCSASKL